MAVYKALSNKEAMFGYVSISSSLCKERCCTKTADDGVVAISEEPNSVVRSGGGNVVRMYCMREASIFNNIFLKIKFADSTLPSLSYNVLP